MKIASLKTTLVRIPFAESIGTAGHAIDSVGCVLVEIMTDEGVKGEGFAYALDTARLRSIAEMIHSFTPVVEGRDPHETEGIWHDLWNEMNASGSRGVTVLAMSAIDTACWDAVGHAAGLPLHKLFGSCREEVDTYASSGLWLSTPVEGLGSVAAGLVEQGFGAVKLRIGSSDRAADVARVRAVREAIGPDVGLLCDANQQLAPKEAIRLGHELEEFDLVWLEDPVSADDRRGNAEVRAALSIPIALGETEYARFGIQAMIDHRSADILMPDLQRIGGLSEFRRSAAIASAHHLPVSSHFFTEYCLCLAGSIKSMISVEHIDWFAPLFLEAPELRDGRLVIPDRPGTGFTFDPEVLVRFALT